MEGPHVTGALVALAAAVVAGGAVLAARRLRAPDRPAPGRRPARAPAASTVVDVASAPRTVVLDVPAADPDDPATERLVHEVAARVLAQDPDAQQVVVRSRDGATLGVVDRPRPRGDVPDLPAELHEPRPPAHRTPDPLPDAHRPPTRPAVRAEDVEDVALHRDLADRYTLPPAVLTELGDRDDPVELVRAILAGAGRPAEVDDDLVRSGDEVVLVTRDGTDQALNHAFLRFQESGASSGVCISLRSPGPSVVRRRELLAPALRHAGSEAFQRMADAAAIGADPIAFAPSPRFEDQTAQ